MAGNNLRSKRNIVVSNPPAGNLTPAANAQYSAP
jgi:hypothetical protein